MQNHKAGLVLLSDVRICLLLGGEVCLVIEQNGNWLSVSSGDPLL